MNRSAKVIPSVAFLFCLAGLLGLYLPLVEGDLGLDDVKALSGVRAVVNHVDTSVGVMPWLGLLLTVVFIGLTALPVIDLVTHQLRWTAWLAVPALLGLLPMVLFTIASIWLADVLARVTGFVGPDLAEIGVGAGAILLIIAEFGLVGVTIAVISARRGARDVEPDIASTISRRPDRDPNL